MTYSGLVRFQMTLATILTDLMARQYSSASRISAWSSAKAASAGSPT